MKKITIAALFLALFLTVIFGFLKKSSPIVNYPPKDGPIIAFGDSLVQGVGATAGNDFPSVLGRLAGRSILNMGRAGDTTRDGLERMDQALAAGPSIALLLLGGNDFLRKIPEAETFANLENIISKFQDSGSVVVLLGAQGGFLTDRYEKAFRRLAGRRGALYVPNVLKGLLGRPEFMADAIHPNDRGYEKISEKIYPTLKEVLN